MEPLNLSKKFSLIDKYRATSPEGYQLLPFRFHRLKAEKYLIVNMVGEHVICDKTTLKSLVSGDLDTQSKFYMDLQAKHFLFDDDSNVALDLLALKFRTKQFPVAQFTSLHIFVVTLRCDYTCKYCQVSRRMEGDNSFDMDEDTAIKSLDLVFKSPSKAIKIEFQGGEPLLNFDLIKFVVLNALERNAIEKRELQFVITTNLSFVDENVLNFCSSNGVYISTSLDGPEELHNQNRPKAGKDGYQKTIDGISAVQNHIGVDAVSALMTTTERSLADPQIIVDEYVKNNLHSIFLRPISPYGFAVKTRQNEKYNIERWMDFFRTGLDYIIKINTAGYFLVEQYTAIILQKILSPSNPGYVDLQSPSGIGISVLVYNYDGDVYASDESRMLKEMGDETFKLGNVHENNYEEILLHDTLLDALEISLPESAPMCSDCGLVTYCGSDPVYHHATQGDFLGKKPLSFFCQKNMSVIEHIFELLESPEKRRILEGWVKC